MAGATYKRLSFSDLKGWAEDDHAAALSVFRKTADAISGAVWQSVVDAAREASDPRGYFEEHFVPVLISDGQPMLFTGYYEPEFAGALAPSAAYPYPAYGVPPDLDPQTPYLTRRQIEETGCLQGQDLELAWLADPVDLYFLQVQGSGRIRLPDGGSVRLGFAAKNGRAYASVGQILIGRGALSPDRVSPDTIRDWIIAQGSKGREILWENESYVFFRRIDDVPADQGPLGAMGRSVTPQRTVAVDPAYTPLGAPVWIEKGGSSPISRLMVAQDTGSAIIGPQRADIFFGTGDAAGRTAGAVKDGGRMVVLLPLTLAASLCGTATDA